MILEPDLGDLRTVLDSVRETRYLLKISSWDDRSSRKSTEQLLAALADAVREWHAEIVEISGAMTGQHFDEETVEAIHIELEAELEYRIRTPVVCSHNCLSKRTSS
jgi:predicted TIM-barrel enzyme